MLTGQSLCQSSQDGGIDLIAGLVCDGSGEILALGENDPDTTALLQAALSPG